MYPGDENDWPSSKQSLCAGDNRNFCSMSYSPANDIRFFSRRVHLTNPWIVDRMASFVGYGDFDYQLAENVIGALSLMYSSLGFESEERVLDFQCNE